MPLPSWPEGLPYQPRRDTFSGKARYASPVSFEVEDGPPLPGAVQSQTSIKEQRISLIFTDAELATFETFAEDTLVQCTSHFMMPVRPPGGTVYVTCRGFIKDHEWTYAPYGTGCQVDFTRCYFPGSAEEMPAAEALMWGSGTISWGSQQTIWM